MFWGDTDNEKCCPDWIIECQNFVCGDPLYDAIMSSIFTDQQVPGCEGSGWWCNPKKGSRIWSINSINSESISEIEDAISDSLEWIKSSVLNTSFEVESEYLGNGQICITITPLIEENCEFQFFGQETDNGWNFDGNFR